MDLNKKEAIFAMLEGKKVQKSRYNRDVTLRVKEAPSNGFDFIDSNDNEVDLNKIGDCFGEIVEEPKEYPLSFFCNVNRDGSYTVHRTREMADNKAKAFQRVACIALDAVATHGQGVDMELSTTRSDNILVNFLAKKGLLEAASSYCMSEVGHDIESKSMLEACFTWKETKEGHDFWSDVAGEYYREKEAL